MLEMTNLTKKLLKSNSQLSHENRALKARLFMKRNGELKDFKKQLKVEKHDIDLKMHTNPHPSKLAKVIHSFIQTNKYTVVPSNDVKKANQEIISDAKA